MSSDVFGDAPFNKHSMNKQGHVSPLNKGHIHEAIEGIDVQLVQGINEDDFRRTAGMAVRATIGIDPDAPTEDYQWEEMLKGGLQTALETQTIVFGVSGVSRTCTHQLVRTRKASFHQQSQRASFMGDHPNIRMPQSVAQNPKAKKAFREAIKASWKAYQVATDEDIAYQDARFVLPEGTETYILCEYPLREFMNVYAYRACFGFQWEISYVFRQMKQELVAEHRWLEPYIKITCEKTKVCEFQGWETMEGFCPLPWAKEDNRRYRPDPSLRIG